MAGGLNLLANLIGKPGKNKIDGSKVQDMYDAGQAPKNRTTIAVNVLDTYFASVAACCWAAVARLRNTAVAETNNG